MQITQLNGSVLDATQHEDINFAIHTERLKVVGLPVATAPRPSREMSLEDLYQQSIGSVVLVAGEAK